MTTVLDLPPSSVYRHDGTDARGRKETRYTARDGSGGCAVFSIARAERVSGGIGG